MKSDPQHPSTHLKKVGEFWSARIGLHWRDVVTARGVIMKAIFPCPGGPRFQLTEPGGNEMAVWSDR